MLSHLRAVERQTGIRPELLDEEPELPLCAAHLWPIFQDLHRSRASTGFGPARITFVDIDAYQRVTRTRLAGWELAAIRRADDCYLTRAAERMKVGGED